MKHSNLHTHTKISHVKQTREENIRALSVAAKNAAKLKELISKLKRCGLKANDLSGESTETSVIKAFEADAITASKEPFRISTPSKELIIGVKILPIAGHCSSTINLYDKIYIVDNGKMIDRIAVSAGGCSR